MKFLYIYIYNNLNKFEGIADDELTIEQLKQRKDRKNNFAIIDSPTML